VFVEQNAKAAACIRQNIAAVSKSVGCDPACARVTQADARTVPLEMGRAPDLVFIDPPYELIPELAPGLFERLGVGLAANPAAIVVFEYPGELELAPSGWTLLKRLGKGARQPTVGFFRRAASAS
jgi:16S rRNA (guanine966-N2)-methyltransferase